MSSQFLPYLESICIAYEQRSNFYTSTDAEDRKLVFDLTVQTAQEKRRDETGESKVRETIERLPVLMGLQKYASEHVLLVGRPGSGKSTALEQLLLESARLAQADAKLPIPVLVQLKADRPILPLIRETLRRYRLRLTESEVDELLFEGKLLLLLDGVNEMPKEALRQELQTFRDDNRNVAMVFTTRDLELGGTLGIEKKLRMEPLTADQLQDFVGKYLPERGAELLNQLNDRLQELAETPLLLKMLCDVFRLQGELPRSRGALFRMFDRQYEEIKGTLPVSADFRRFKSELLQHLAFGMLEGEALEPQLRLSRFEAERRLENFLKDRVSAPGQVAKEWLEDLLEHHLLQVAEDPRQIEFHHQLFLEYYAAEALLNRFGSLDGEQLQQEFLNFLKWTEPLALMLALVEDEAQAERVVQLALEVDRRLGSRLAGEVKPEFQQKTVGFVTALELPNWLRVELLGVTRSDSAIPALLKLLEHDSAYVRWRVAKTLGQTGSQTAVSTLLKLLENDNSDACESIVNALGEIGSQTAIPDLLKLLEDDDSDVRERAAEALGKIGSQTAIPDLLKLLEDDDSNVRERAAEALGEIGSQTAIPALLKLLENGDSWVGDSVAEALGKIGSQTAVPDLLELLENGDSWVGDSVVEALGRIGSQTAIPALLKLLGDDNSDVRERAAEALGRIGSQTAIPALLKLLEDDTSFVRRSAAFALGEVGSQTAVPDLLKLLEDDTSSVRRSVAFALGKIGSQTAIPTFLKLAEDDDFWVRSSAVEALGRAGSEAAIPNLLKLIEYDGSWIRQKAARALGRIGSETAIPGLLKLLEHDNSDVCRNAAYTLGEIGAETAILCLLKLLEHNDSNVRWRAVNALGDLAKKCTDTIAPHLPHLLTLIPTDSGEHPHRAILAIQENCKYYNYEVFQDYLQAQKADQPTDQNNDRPATTIYNFPNATEGKIFENVDRYYETPPKDPS